MYLAIWGLTKAPTGQTMGNYASFMFDLAEMRIFTARAVIASRNYTSYINGVDYIIKEMFSEYICKQFFLSEH